MSLTQQWTFLNLTRNSFFHLISCKKYHEFRQIISSRLYVRSNRACSVARRALL